jgi:ribosomal protein RSM22 (predicted rRNA methylase)
MRLPDALSRAIEQEVSRFDSKALTRAAEELSREYRGGHARKAPLQSDLHRAAYLVTRVPATHAAVHTVLEETMRRLPQTSIRSLLDLGTGPGTAAWAAVEIFPEIEQITLVERDAEFLSLGKDLAAQSPHAAVVNATWRQGDLNSVAELPRHDLVVASYSLGELSQSESLLRKAWDAAQVALLVVEPGTPRGFQTILAARQYLVGAGAQIAAPCPHDRECPLAGSKDWCHFAVRLERSALHRHAKSVTMGYEDEKFSYVVAAKADVVRAAARILRHPMKHKGHIQLELCMPVGLKTQVVTKTDRENFRGARKAEWGDEWN